MKANEVGIWGRICSRCERYCTLKSQEESGRVNNFRVWGMPKQFAIGDYVMVKGILACNCVSRRNTKMVLGVKAKEISTQKEECFLKFSGEICSKGELRFTKEGQKLLNLIVKIDDDTLVPVIVWNRKAEGVYRLRKIGDIVEVQGFLQSREYTKFIDGIAVKKVTNEVSAFFIEAVD